ncbi:hypothetical protein SAMN06295879_3563 [Agreia bicolorata]|uniref:Uncharacterized protein n=1 Tax=Agreia bicolorata TaxID=110935 RepID=A0A1T4YLD0_9MICO|nr:hypothetical protein [Agreia bicolorata]SKB02609.1 hypothetical protein SAMN06295879_3563 [Agreia bicolorata]
MLLNLLPVPLGGALAAVVFTQIPSDVYPMQALAWYTIWAMLLSVGLAIALAITRQMPTVERGIVDGSPAQGVRAWRGERLFDTGFDLGLGGVAAVLTAMGLVAGGEWVVPSLLVAAVGAWFAVRAVLSTVGPRREEALWLTDDRLVHYSKRGRESCERGQIQLVRAMNDMVMILVDGPIDRHLVPLPWRLRRPAHKLREHTMWFRIEHVGHSADQLATWLQTELGIDAHGLPTRTQ